jgi:hypothetical protein
MTPTWFTLDSLVSRKLANQKGKSEQLCTTLSRCVPVCTNNGSGQEPHFSVRTMQQKLPTEARNWEFRMIANEGSTTTRASGKRRPPGGP